MRKQSDQVYLKHILEAGEKVTSLVNRGGRELYDSDFAIADAIVRELLVVGEAARNLSDETKKQFPNIPWKDVVGMRDWLVHGYSEIDWNKVWNTAIGDVPMLVKALKPVLEGTEVG
ncbi:hypothetical protein A2W24_01255 [Microgenomates group bacterium RBG_16_45_19]|nr:MAG: hypothetical protein A2W24_01255 [Microgenomates group bacterium RBG_16_45_19]